jgi:divalent metal cation (Fe/Co/Zn/Cd) transporter
MTALTTTSRDRLVRRGFVLEYATLGWNVVVTLAVGHHAEHSTLGIAWTVVSAVVMFALAAGKARTGAALHNPVLRTEGRVTLLDGLLAVAVLLGLALNTAAGWWWADPIAGYIIICYATKEAWQLLRPH